MTKTPDSKWQVLPAYDRNVPSWDTVTTKADPEGFVEAINSPETGYRGDELTVLMQQINYISGVHYKWSSAAEAYVVTCTSEDATTAFREWVERDVVPWGCTVVKARV